jgi:hypothetical protein
MKKPRPAKSPSRPTSRKAPAPTAKRASRPAPDADSAPAPWSELGTPRGPIPSDAFARFSLPWLKAERRWVGEHVRDTTERRARLLRAFEDILDGLEHAAAWIADNKEAPDFIFSDAAAEALVLAQRVGRLAGAISNRARREAGLRFRKCQECGKPLTPTQRVYCSKTCMNRAGQRRYRRAHGAAPRIDKTEKR